MGFRKTGVPSDTEGKSLGEVKPRVATSSYVFDVIQADTTNAPNESHDAFFETELFRFEDANED